MLPNCHATEPTASKLLGSRNECFQIATLQSRLFPNYFTIETNLMYISLIFTQGISAINARNWWWEKNFWCYRSHLPNPSVNLCGPHQGTFNNSNLQYCKPSHHKYLPLLLLYLLCHLVPNCFLLEFFVLRSLCLINCS